MSVYVFMKIFAWVLLGSPVALVLISLLCTFFPAAADFLSTIFWEMVGQLEAFELASQVVQTGLSQQHFSGENYGLWLFTLLFDTMLESLVMACCIYIAKITQMRFGRKFQVIYKHPVWKLTLAGVIGGAVACRVLEILAPAMERIISICIYLGCLLYGLKLMMAPTTRGGTYFNRKWGYLGSMLLEIFCNMVNAMSGVLILTCVFEGPRFINAGGSIGTWLAWIGMSVAVMYLMYSLTVILKPNKV